MSELSNYHLNDKLFLYNTSKNNLPTAVFWWVMVHRMECIKAVPKGPGIHTYPLVTEKLEPQLQMSFKLEAVHPSPPTSDLRQREKGWQLNQSPVANDLII